MNISINLSFFAGRKTIAKQKQALEAARVAMLNLADHKTCQKSLCDYCPVSNIGSEEHNMIKDYDLSKIICPLRREYSK